MFPFFRAVPLGEPRPWTIKEIVVNGVDHSDDFSIQQDLEINDLVKKQTIHSGYLRIPSNKFGKSRSLEIKMATDSVRNNSCPLVEIHSLYQTDHFKIELEAFKGRVAPALNHDFSKEAGSFASVGFNRLYDLVDLDEASSMDNIVCKNNKIIWETKSMKHGYIYKIDTALEDLDSAPTGIEHREEEQKPKV